MIQVTIQGDTLAAIAKQASELASSLANPAPVAAAPKAAQAAAAPTPPPAAAPKATPAPAAASKAAPKAATPAPKAAAPTEGEATIASLREQGRQLIKAGKNTEFKAALTSVGADSITTLDPSKYNDLSVALAAILTPAEAPEGDGL